jgi:hypothetical protein
MIGMSRRRRKKEGIPLTPGARLMTRRRYGVEDRQGFPSFPKHAIFTAFLDAPFLATTPHGCDPEWGEEDPTPPKPAPSLLFLTHRSSRALRHVGDPLDAPDGLGLQSRTTVFPYPHLAVHKPMSYSSNLPRYQSPVPGGNARPPLRVPTALDDVPARKALIIYGRRLKD